MSCCGGKRNAWMQELNNPIQNSIRETTTEVVQKMETEKIFEYTGNSSRKVIGAVSGEVYHFRFKGHTLNVSFADSFSLMAEGELKLKA